MPDSYEAESVAVLERALARVPGYAHWRACDPGPGCGADERYAALPPLTKQDLRDRFPDGYVLEGLDLDAALASGKIEFAQTSGSSADSVTIVFSSDWWDASERAAWELNAHARRVATGRHAEAVLASPRCVGPGYSADPLPATQRTLGRHLYLNQSLNPADWRDADLRRMVRELNAHEPVVLEADPPYLAAFCRGVTRLGLEVYQPELIFLTYSYPSRIYRRLIATVFEAPIASSYGSTETGHVFMECEAGRLHQNTAHCRVDLEPWGNAADGAALARMLVTVFHNPWSVILRFDIGDVARLDTRGPCPCGRREGLVLAAIDGRTHDITYAPDGAPVTVARVDAALAGIPGVHGWQLDQPGRAVYEARILADRPDAPVADAAAAALSRIYGPEAEVRVEPTEALMAELSGKFRFARTGGGVARARPWE